MKRVYRATFFLSLCLSLGLLPQAGVSKAATKAKHFTQSLSLSATPVKASMLAQRSNRAGSLRVLKRLIKENNRRRQYTIDASYPQLVGAQSANVAELNRTLKELITKEVNDFKKNVGPPDSNLPKDIQQNYLDAGYTIEHQSADLISVSFGFSTYYAGAAHPNRHTLVLNYDLKAGRTLTLADLFNPRSGYMQTISAYTIRDLKKQLGPSPDTEWIERGAGPASENYKNWTITPKGLNIMFDPYQVASYAEGSHLVVIPYSALRSVINTEGPLGPLAQRSPMRRGRR
ncbi:MAG: DUF3298 domain-containing protein [Pyrinomonadaceae bacterium]|nr:DUF3298 domain-containing protein [Pyrinomonadaceae bacterium]